MSTLQERMQYQGAPSVLTPALFKFDNGKYSLIETCSYEDSLEKAKNGVVAGFIDEELGRWKVDGRTFFDNGTREVY